MDITEYKRRLFYNPLADCKPADCPTCKMRDLCEDPEVEDPTDPMLLEDEFEAGDE